MEFSPDFLFFPKNYFPDAKTASVGVILYQDKLSSQKKIAMILRNKYPGVHSNQIGFFGGKFDSRFDKNLLDTCLRECFEESGISVPISAVKDRLPDIYIHASNFKVRPFFIDFEGPLPALNLDPNEVAEFISLPLEILWDNSYFQNKPIELFTGETRLFPCIFWQERIIWGASYMILLSLKEYLQEKKDTLL